jgi:small subunit ribosomal protein S5
MYQNRGNQGGRGGYQREPSEFEEQIVQINRVSKKTKGGNKIGFSALAVVGDKKGKVGVGLGKAPDVSAAIRKGIAYAKKHLIEVPLVHGTIPFRIDVKVGAAKIMLKPAPPGSGVIAGGAVRSVVSAAGIQNISSKVLGTNNKANNVHATLEALKQVSEQAKKHAERRAKKSVKAE